MLKNVHTGSLLLLTFLMLSCSGGKGGASGDVLATDLVEKGFEVTGDQAIPGGYSVGFPRTAEPLSAYKLPEGHTEGLLYDLGWQRRTPAERQVPISAKYAAFRYKREIWVDWNKDRRFASDEKQLEVGTAGRRTLYKPTGAPKDFDGLLLGYSGGEDHSKDGGTQKWISVAPATYLQGEVELGGKRVGIKLIDGDLDLTFGPAMDIMGGDLIGIDYDLDGMVAVGDYPWDPKGSELAQLGATHSFPNGKDYVVQVSADRKKLTLVADPAPTGKVRLDLDVEGMVAVSQGPEHKQVPVVDGHLVLRAGQYELNGLTYRVKDDKGGKWLMFMQQPAQKYLTVSPNATPVITAKPPYGAGCRAYAERGEQMISFWVHDGARNYVQPIEGPDGPVALPKCTITDEKGHEVFRAQMQWWGGELMATWTPSKGAKGIYYVGVRWPLALWGDLQATTRLRL